MADPDKSLPWLDVLDKWIIRFTVITGGIGLAVMVLLTFWNVIVMRKMLNAPILGAAIGLLALICPPLFLFPEQSEVWIQRTRLSVFVGMQSMCSTR